MNTDPVNTDPVEEARHYVNNARQILSQKAEKEDGYYKDPKYVKTAGHQAYTGVLVALDGIIPAPKRGRRSEEWYRKNLAVLDQKLLDTFNDAYNSLHLAMGYDGNRSASVAEAGLQEAERIISWVENRLRNA